MSTSSKQSFLLVTIVASVIVAALTLTACGGSQPTAATSSSDVTMPDTSVLLLGNDSAVETLMADMEAGNLPTEANVLYDAMGSRPDVKVTDAETIKELYRRLTQMTVDGETDMSVTDAYHHIYFSLADGTQVGYSFEGEDILVWQGKNYTITDRGGLFPYIFRLQDEQMKAA